MGHLKFYPKQEKSFTPTGEKALASLTDKKIQALKPKEKSYKMYDENGLFLVISPKGTKTWRYKYKVGEIHKEITLGKYPILSLLEARNKRNDAMKQRLEGIDPAEYKQAKKKEQFKKEIENSMTFEKVIEDWLRIQKIQWKSNTYKGNIDRINLHIMPILGPIPMIKLTFEDVKKVPLKLEQDGKYDAARKIAQIINQVCMYAKLNQWVQHNIADGLTKVLAGKPKIKQRELPAITEPQGVAKMLQSIQNYIEYRRMLFTPMGGALKLAPLLALRPSELLAAQWHELDFEKALFKIPAERMKANKKHEVPLSKQALAIFQELFNRRTDNRYVFKSSGKKGHLIPESVNKAMHGAGIPLGEMCAHGWRKVFSTLCNNALIPRILIEKCLAHSIGNEVEQAYNKAQYLNARRIVMQWWADYLDALREGTQRPVFKLDRASI